MRASVPVVALVVLSVSLLYTTLGGDYSITRWTVDTGGGTCTGGAYRVTGTIGQPDAGRVTNTNVILGCGYWPDLSGLIPYLDISRSGEEVTLSWEDYGSLYDAKETDRVVSNLWSSLPEPKKWEGDKIKVRTSTFGAWSNRFFRLRKP